ncbi:MAG: HIT domain-containing protein [Candidatus Aenigmarchaeota archaeon]|nr:HIT domain-containing protein [Candidatus Aenigmarchaeota archaeon]
MPEKCVFCDIVNKKIKAFVVYEDLNSIAFLDIAPRSAGMTIIAPKQHYIEFDENLESSTTVFQAAQIVGKMIKKALNPLTVDFSIIPSQEVPHFHIRVYPVYEKEIPLVENQPMQTTEQELNDVANKIKAVHVEMPKKEVPMPEVKDEKSTGPSRSKEDVYWIKRESEVT